jgi:type VI secretion system protein ImpH
MQTSQWLPGVALVRRLLDEPWRFQFMQAVRILDCWLGRADVSRLDPRIRFRNRISLRFPQSEIDDITIESWMPIDTGEQLEQARQAGAIERINITAAVVSLLGSTGQMPYAFTRRVLATQEKGRIEGVRAFLDMLSQRSVELFYQARMQYAIDSQERDGFLSMPLAIAGARTVTVPEPAEHENDEPLVADEVAATMRRFCAGAVRRRWHCKAYSRITLACRFRFSRL